MPHVGDVRGEGMLCAVEFVEDRDSRTFFDPAKRSARRSPRRCSSAAVIARAMPQGDILGFAPPFCLTRDEADHVVDRDGAGGQGGAGVRPRRITPPRRSAPACPASAGPAQSAPKPFAFWNSAAVLKTMPSVTFVAPS